MKMQVPFEEMFVPGEVADAVAMKERMTALVQMLGNQLVSDDFGGFRDTLRLLNVNEPVLWEMHTRRIYYDQGYKQGVVDMKEEAPALNGLLGKLGASLTITHIQIGGAQSGQADRA